VVRGGRTFLRNLINQLPLMSEPHHYIRLSASAKSDINWWLIGLRKFHGYTSFACDLTLPSHVFSLMRVCEVAEVILIRTGIM
jgi:hypothetical protein